jgi:hypothetical protein
MTPRACALGVPSRIRVRQCRGLRPSGGSQVTTACSKPSLGAALRVYTQARRSPAAGSGRSSPRGSEAEAGCPGRRASA